MIEFIKKIINWFKSFFSKENKKSDKVLEEKYNKSKISKNNKKVLINIAPMDGSIGNKKLHKEYYEILPKDLIIFQKLERLRLDASDEEEDSSELLVDYFVERAEEMNTHVEFISTETEEGMQLLRAFGGIAAILRYRVK